MRRLHSTPMLVASASALELTRTTCGICMLTCPAVDADGAELELDAPPAPAIAQSADSFASRPTVSKKKAQTSQMLRRAPSTPHMRRLPCVRTVNMPSTPMPFVALSSRSWCQPPHGCRLTS
ncbi:hypothetical protein L1887_47425 [Cichorium endivia]|nr:hypothetical protein L1887_47425 [Cichorium endivia]